MTVASDVIIDVPECRTPFLRVRDWILTAILWTLWIYICRHILLFLGWTAGVYDGILEIDAMLELRGVADRLQFYGEVSLSVALLIVAWSLWSRDLPDWHQRPSHVPRVDRGQIAEFFDIDAAQAARCVSARRITMHHRDDGLLSAIEIGWDAGDRAAGRREAAGDDLRVPPRTSVIDGIEAVRERWNQGEGQGEGRSGLALPGVFRDDRGLLPARFQEAFAGIQNLEEPPR